VPGTDAMGVYTHWSWYHQTAKGFSGTDCVLAYRSYQYAQYTGGGAASLLPL
jgi:hypothetical protein